MFAHIAVCVSKCVHVQFTYLQFLGRQRRPYIVFRFRFLYAFMFVYIYIYIYNYIYIYIYPVAMATVGREI